MSRQGLNRKVYVVILVVRDLEASVGVFGEKVDVIVFKIMVREVHPF